MYYPIVCVDGLRDALGLLRLLLLLVAVVLGGGAPASGRGRLLLLLLLLQLGDLALRLGDLTVDLCNVLSFIISKFRVSKKSSLFHEKGEGISVNIVTPP